MGFALGLALKGALIFYLGTIVVSFLDGLCGEKNRRR